MAGPAHPSPQGAGTASLIEAASAEPGSDGAVQVSTDGAADAVCPYFHEAVELVGKRWTGAIVGALLPEPRRFGEIAQAVPQISDRLLSMRLRELESEGIVQREVLPGSPVRVRYCLTAKGRGLEPAIAELRNWACNWLKPLS